jgi:predicted metal-binding membrane protein
MWSAMMAAMMLPAAAPMIVAFARAQRARAATQPAVPTAIFVAGYLAVWSAFSAGAATLQWALHRLVLVSDTHVAEPVLGAALLLVAGSFQWTKLKDACLARCQSPLGFLATEWREGRRGALVMGLRHGAFCTGCCWALMLLMLVGGAMNLLVMAALAIYVLAEKALFPGRALSRAAGALLIAAGAGLALSAAL